MRLGPILLALAFALSACGKRQPDFDERYQAANVRISQAAEEIDARIEASGAPAGEPTNAPR